MNVRIADTNGTPARSRQEETEIQRTPKEPASQAWNGNRIIPPLSPSHDITSMLQRRDAHGGKTQSADPEWVGGEDVKGEGA